jgi:hypothetical protein
MKKVILSAMLYASLAGFSQETSSALLYTPQQAQGYMVLNSNDNPNVNVGILNILLRAQT